MVPETSPSAIAQPAVPPRTSRPGLETSAALAGTALVAAWLLLTSFNAGPLWRDETNSINVANMPSLKELWNNLPFESFPPLWLLLLRVWSWVGMAESDAGIRILGLFVGLAFLGSLWLCTRWFRGHAPMLSLALLGSLPAFINTVGANRAYGLAMGLLVLTFGMIWRLLESPSRFRIILAGLASLLFVHCVYYDAVFLCAMLAGAAAVTMRRGQWRIFAVLVGIGTVAGLSMAIYLPVVRQTSLYARMVQVPLFSFATVWEKFNEAVALQSSAHWGSSAGPEVWVWISILLAGIALALAMQFRRGRSARASEAQPAAIPAADASSLRADLALFSGLSMFCGLAGYLCFLLKLHFPTQPWYYMGLFTLCTLSLDGVLTAGWPVLRPWGLLRIAFMAVMMVWGARATWEEVHTRRSNLDLIAAVIENQASEGDLVAVQSMWEGITFDRYYHGRAKWVTVPPISSHKVHRTDLVWAELSQPDAMASVLREISNTLRSGKRVWVVGDVAVLDKLPAPPPSPPHPQTGWYLAPYYRFWTAQLGAHLVRSAVQTRTLKLPLTMAVNAREDLSLTQFSGYRQGAEQPIPQQPTEPR